MDVFINTYVVTLLFVHVCNINSKDVFNLTIFVWKTIKITDFKISRLTMKVNYSSLK